MKYLKTINSQKTLKITLCILVLICITAFIYTASYTDYKAQADVWDGSAATYFAGGSGVNGDPYLIESASQLALLAELINAGVNAEVVEGHGIVPYATLQTAYYKLNNDIVLNNETFTFDPDTGLVEMTDGTNTAYLGTGVKGKSGGNATFDNTPSVRGTIYTNKTGTVGAYSGAVNP